MGAGSSGSSAMSRVRSSAWASGWLLMFSGSGIGSGLVVSSAVSVFGGINLGSGDGLFPRWVGSFW